MQLERIAPSSKVMSSLLKKRTVPGSRAVMSSLLKKRTAPGSRAVMSSLLKKRIALGSKAARGRRKPTLGATVTLGVKVALKHRFGAEAREGQRTKPVET